MVVLHSGDPAILILSSYTNIFADHFSINAAITDVLLKELNLPELLQALGNPELDQGLVGKRTHPPSTSSGRAPHYPAVGGTGAKSPLPAAAFSGASLQRGRFKIEGKEQM